MESTNLEQLMRQTRAYQYSDGLIEIMLGLLFTCLGVFIYVFRDSPAEVGIAGALVLGAVIVISGRVIQQIRLRFTYPRTGYVRLDHVPSTRFRVLRVAVALAAGILTAIVLMTVTGRADWNALALAVCFLVYFAAEWRRVGQIRWLVLAFSALLLALALAILPLTPPAAFLAMSTWLGLGLLVCGLYALVRYLRTPPAENTP